MKKVLSAALALSLLGGTAAMAQPYGHAYGHDDHGRYDRHDDRRMHRWTRGERLPSNYYRSHSYYVDYRSHHLRKPPRGYQWVRVDNNYMMVALATGLISQIIANQ